ncbi:MAG: hypothetical protein AAGD22_10990 [Verrucomicrobiota bacterium]
MKSRPWLYIVLTFVILIAVWTVFITIAVKNQPQSVPLDSPMPKTNTNASPS